MEQFTLSDFFITKNQAADFAVRLSKLSDRIYTTNFNLENTLLELFGIQKKDKLIALFRENNVALESPTALKECIATIQSAVSSLPVLSLTISFEPTEEILKAFSEWFVMNVHKQMLLDFVVDPRLIAGASLSYKGTYKDYSYRLPVEKLLGEIQSASQKSQQTAVGNEQAPPAGNVPLPTVPVGQTETMQQSVNTTTS